jgi:phosphoglycolate phosphatase
MGSRKKLLLFDIDGTLLHCGRVWIESYLGAVEEEFPGWSLPQVNFGGKTDRWIARTLIAARYGETLPEAQLEASCDRILARYLQRVSQHRQGRVQQEVTLLPGVIQLLQEVKHVAHLYNTVLTGNVRQGAEWKLEAAGVANFFDLQIGAFGCDHWLREELPARALERVAKKHGQTFRGKEIVILGDTAHDVTCGRHLGVKTIAVGTGNPAGREAMLAEKPDVFFENFSNVSAVLEAILSD